jgi:predicted CXXCH cytochrome family protein
MSSFKFRHSIAEDNCATCHIQRNMKFGRTWEVVATEKQKDWIFFLEGLTSNRAYRINLTIKDNYGNKLTSPEFQITPAEVTQTLTNDRQPPEILDISVDEVRQAIFLEAFIKAVTDEPSSIVVEYGTTSRYGERVSAGNTFSSMHRVRIPGLRHHKIYHFRVTFRDIFGNTTVSKDYVLDTSGATAKAPRRRTIITSKPALNDLRIYRSEGTNDVYVSFSSDRPVKPHMRVIEPSEMDNHGFGFMKARFTQIDVCGKCHPLGASHPVGVRSNGISVRIPSGLPTIRGGMITCVTCHFPHGGDKRYFVRLEGTKDLCVSCHTDGAF